MAFKKNADNTTPSPMFAISSKEFVYLRVRDWEGLSFTGNGGNNSKKNVRHYLFIFADSGSFATDSEISGKGPGRERELTPWMPEGVIPENLTIEFAILLVLHLLFRNTFNLNVPWDQFKVNEDLFGVKTTYTEEQYTTKLDKSSQLYKMRSNEAARIARDLEQVALLHTHLLYCRRGQVMYILLKKEAKFLSQKI